MKNRKLGYKILTLIIFILLILHPFVILSEASNINPDVELIEYVPDIENYNVPITVGPIDENYILKLNPTNTSDISDANEDIPEEVIEEEEDTIGPYDVFTEYEIDLLAKLVMCEAEGESQKCKEYVAQTVLNRIESNKFPNTMEGVIFQINQFTPTFDGRWNSVKPNQDCYDAIYVLFTYTEPITEALYFEACKTSSSWHDRNLTRVAEIDNTRFYVE